MEPISVRTLLKWFSSYRRGWWVAKSIKDAFSKLQLYTFPDFNNVYIDTLIEFRKVIILSLVEAKNKEEEEKKP